MDVLNGKPYEDSALINNDVARVNVDNLLHSLELVLFLVEYPSQSIYYEEFRDARDMGKYPDDVTLPPIFEKYFSIPLNNFLTNTYTLSRLTDFEEECIKTFSSISFDQLYASYQELLILWAILTKVPPSPLH